MIYYESKSIDGSLSTLFNIRNEKQNTDVDYANWHIIHPSLLFADCNRIYAVKQKDKSLLEIEQGEEYNAISLDGCDSIDIARQEVISYMILNFHRDFDHYVGTLEFLYKGKRYEIFCEESYGKYTLE